jgi:hypothetical protein
MTRSILLSSLLLVLGEGYLVFGQSPTTSCKVHFSVVRKDALNNVQQGLVGDDLKWMQTKMAKKYPPVCYVPPDPTVPVVFYIALAKDIYHGTRTVAQHGTVTDSTIGSDTYGQTVATTETDQQVPYSSPYTILTLSVETQPGGKGESWTVRQTFQNNSLHRELYGVAVTNRHPYHLLIEQAMQWVQNGGLDNPLQSVTTPAHDSRRLPIPATSSETPPNNSPVAQTKVAVSSTPPGAEIELDGKFVGSTPSELNILEGSHTVEIKKTGFKLWQRNLTVTAGSTVQIHADLDAQQTVTPPQ